MARVLGLALIAVAVGCSFEPVGDSVDATPDAPALPPRDCLDAYQHGTATDGVITIDPDGPGIGVDPFEAYCEMTTASGGWTLVYAYEFTNYASFTSGSNAITPRPSWPYTSVETSVPISTTLPRSPQQAGALDYARWHELGTQFLVTSTINNWLACTPVTGDLGLATNGDITCTIVKRVATACAATSVPPTKLFFEQRGPGLYTTTFFASVFYYWDGSVQVNWPTHDPCGTNSPNQLPGVADPRGAIYLRR